MRMIWIHTIRTWGAHNFWSGAGVEDGEQHRTSFEKWRLVDVF